jgi:hypothetical protein
VPGKKQDDRHHVAPVLRVAPLGELKVYTVTEAELDAIGRGSPGTVFLNFALALLPLSAAFVITLLSTTITQLGTLVFFVSACILCFLVGLLCLVLAVKYHTSTAKVIEKIKNRMPPPIGQGAEDAPASGRSDPAHGEGSAPGPQ